MPKELKCASFVDNCIQYSYNIAQRNDIMSTVRINPRIKEEVSPILSDLGISLSEAINMFLHQVKLNNGLPFELKIKKLTELNDGYGSYVCDFGYIHDYSKYDLKNAKTTGKLYGNAREMMEDILVEEDVQNRSNK